MTTFHFGTQYDPAHYVEIPDPANAGQVKRPDAGVTLKVRNHATLGALPDVTTTTYGYWSTTTTDIPQIQVSGDGGSTWVGPLDGAEARTSAITSGVDATTALTTANAAITRVGNLEQVVASGGGGGGGAVSSVSGRTGAVTLAKADVGLPLVDNTADTAKPISAPTAAALAGKQPTIRKYADATAAAAGLAAGEFADGDLIIVLA